MRNETVGAEATDYREHPAFKPEAIRWVLILHYGDTPTNYSSNPGGWDWSAGANDVATVVAEIKEDVGHAVLECWHFGETLFVVLQDGV